MLRRLSSFAAGPRSKWVVIAAWVIVGLALVPVQPKLQEATTTESEEFLPASAESTEVSDLIESRFASGHQVDAVVVYEREGGLTAADRARVRRDGLTLAGLAAPNAAGHCANPDLTRLLTVVVPGQGFVCGASGESAVGDGLSPRRAGGSALAATLVSGDGSIALLAARLGDESSDEIRDDVDYIRGVVPGPDAPPDQLRSYTSGLAGNVSDSVEAFESLDVTLLAVTVSLVLVLLLAIYRSPVIALVPLFVVALAYVIAAAATYGLVEAGVFEVNFQTTSILIVLMFGAGTDYCLLLVSRYREELRRSADRHAAIARATERAGPPILSAGATVMAAMLVLALADFKATQTMGPVLALGVAIILLAGLTLLPALLAVLGRRSFWPAIPRLATEQRRPLGFWRRLGNLIHEHPNLALLGAVTVLLAGTFGNLANRGTLNFGEGFRDPPESVRGQELIARKLSPGLTAPTTILASSDVAGPVAAAARSLPGVDGAVPTGVSDDGELVRIEATLVRDPFSDEAGELIPSLRETVKGAAEGETALVGGTTAENFDGGEALRSDARLIVPLVLALIMGILGMLLRAIVAPLYLIATVVLSYGFAIGVSTLVFTRLLNQPDLDPSLPILAFIFLVALGVDYNIFLISRIREQASEGHTKEAVIEGLERTGGVITSAGLILAGTFSALASLPLDALLQIGLTVAFGLLVDTFIVRTVLVPAIAFKFGERNWWPSKPSPVAAGRDLGAAGAQLCR